MPLYLIDKDMSCSRYYWHSYHLTEILARLRFSYQRSILHVSYRHYPVGTTLVSLGAGLLICVGSVVVVVVTGALTRLCSGCNSPSPVVEALATVVTLGAGCLVGVGLTALGLVGLVAGFRLVLLVAMLLRSHIPTTSTVIFLLVAEGPVVEGWACSPPTSRRLSLLTLLAT